ncbi:MAG TPA: hypothetical protein PLJ16_02840 [Casimicrobium huifangae]|nr:hypothetical protein [Casimicrobium huifangae]
MRIETIGNATRIYALCEYPSMVPRYVGKTVQYLHERHKAHIRAAKAGKRLPVHYWLRKQIANGQRLAISLIEYAGDDWPDRERYWIDEYRRQGHSLLNLTRGGEGLAGYVMPKQHREKIAAALDTRTLHNCLLCGNEFKRKANEVRKGHAKFCSRQCANTHNKGGHRGA